MDKSVIMVSSDYFDAKSTLDSGQCFRYRQENGGYRVYSAEKSCFVFNEKQNCVIECRKEDEGYFANYFDLQTDYQTVVDEVAKIGCFREAALACKGVRILRQDPFETIFSFILSANNNIKRIKRSMEEIAKGAGRQGEDGYAFPTAHQASEKDEAFYQACGAGYRAKYLAKTAQMIATGFDLNISHLESGRANEYLRQLSGVGEKVADCILLFAYHRTDVFPVDVWIEKAFASLAASEPALAKYRNNTVKSRKEIASILRELCGNYAGYAQQYLYYYKREVER